MDNRLQEIARDVISQATDEGLDPEDAFWMAQGALIREARTQGIIGEELSPEMQACVEQVVKSMQGKGKK